MKKPHEQDLTAELTGTSREGDTWLHRDDDEAVAVVFGDAGYGWASLFKAAPDMARALETLATLLGEDPDFTNPKEADCYAALEKAKEALRKAGVLP